MNKKTMPFWHKFFSFIYEKRKHGNAMSSVEKQKMLGITVFKRVVLCDKIETTYLTFFCFTKSIPILEEFLDVNSSSFDTFDVPMPGEEFPLVSVIVPNYNHAHFLRERLDSIYQQTYKNIEVILLDDASSDESVDILEDYVRRYPDNTRLIVNDKNTGKVFVQWNRGLDLAKGEYIWIAESDDYCDKKFLEELLVGLRHQSVMLSFARSVFMKNGGKIWSLKEYWADLPISWDAPFVMSAYELVGKAFAVKNVVPNVSSAVFRNIGTIPNEITAIWEEMSLCGDWLFYLWLIRGGAVSYTNRVINYYRIHEKSTSLKIQNTLAYYIETYKVSCFVAQSYVVDFSVFESLKSDLAQHYMNRQHVESYEKIEEIYDIEKIRTFAKRRCPNVAICSYALTQGGGEILPVYLANELKRQGVAVTFIDFRGVSVDKEIRKKLNRNIPLIELRNGEYLKAIISSLGIEIIHTHEGSVDRTVARAIQDREQLCKHIITLHGMYEAISKTYLEDILKLVVPSCSCFVYIADKNLVPFEGVSEPVQLRKIGNGLPKIPVFPHSRMDLGIEENAFCLALVSRAVFDKGWIEAIEAVKIANEKSERPIHLLLIGDGECYDYLQNKDLPSYIHLLGRKSDVRNYFAMSDIGLLPSRFKGESFPLVLIESLMSGTPVVASDIGEVRCMLADEEGNMAGIVFNLNNWAIPVDELAQIILLLSTDGKMYKKLKERVEKVAGKFDITHMAKQYRDVYDNALNSFK